MRYSEKKINTLLAAIYDGRITQGNLPEDLYFAIANHLKKGLYEGFGGTILDFSGPPLELLQELRENIYMFSGAKTFQTVRAVESLVKENGELRPFKEFRQVAIDEYNLFNKTWAQTEYDTCIGSGQSAYRWTQIEADRDVFPYIQLTVVEDSNTTIICRPLDKLIFEIDDPAMKKYYPPNHFNCRTGALSLDKYARPSSRAEVDRALKHMDDHMPEVFKMNVGLDRVVFSKEHGYFSDVPKELARKNFNLPIPNKD